MFLPTNITLKLGDSGDFVTELQRRLSLVNCFNANSINGFFDGQTVNGVSQFQSMHGIRADGIAGPETLRRLNGAISGDNTAAAAPATQSGVYQPGSMMEPLYGIATAVIAAEVLHEAVAQPTQHEAPTYTQPAPAHYAQPQQSYPQQSHAQTMQPLAAEMLVHQAQHTAIPQPQQQAYTQAPQPIAQTYAFNPEHQPVAHTQQPTYTPPQQQPPVYQQQAPIAVTQHHQAPPQQQPPVYQQQAPQQIHTAPISLATPPAPQAAPLAMAQQMHQQPQAYQQPVAAQAPQHVAEPQVAPEQQRGMLGRAVQYANDMVQKLANYFESKLPSHVINEVKEIGMTMAKGGVKEVAIPSAPEQQRGIEGQSRGQQQGKQIG